MLEALGLLRTRAFIRLSVGFYSPLAYTLLTNFYYFILFNMLNRRRYVSNFCSLFIPVNLFIINLFTTGQANKRNLIRIHQ
jgi:hypothetical protein